MVVGEFPEPYNQRHSPVLGPSRRHRKDRVRRVAVVPTLSPRQRGSASRLCRCASHGHFTAMGWYDIWLLPLSVMFLRFISAVSCVSASFVLPDGIHTHSIPVNTQSPPGSQVLVLGRMWGG